MFHIIMCALICCTAWAATWQRRRLWALQHHTVASMLLHITPFPLPISLHRRRLVRIQAGHPAGLCHTVMVHFNIFPAISCTTGASSDFKQATQLARAMVTRYGMSAKLGAVSLDYDDDGRSMSMETRAAVESEVKELLTVRFLVRFDVLQVTQSRVSCRCPGFLC